MNRTGCRQCQKKTKKIPLKGSADERDGMNKDIMTLGNGVRPFALPPVFSLYIAGINNHPE
jgi:hypothetical protein